MSATKTGGRRTANPPTPTEPMRAVESVGPDYEHGMLPFREAGTSWPSHVFRFLGRLGRMELALVCTSTPLTFIAWQLLRIDPLPPGAVWCIGVIALMILAIGLAALFAEDKSNGKGCEARTDEASQSGDG